MTTLLTKETPAAAVEQCPVLALQPVLMDMPPRTVQHNFEQLADWTRRLCQHLRTLVVDGGTP